MVDSPLDSLYYMIKSVFAPALRDGKSGSANSSQIQSSLTDLEQVLRAAGKKSGSSAIGNIFQPRDELEYWQNAAKGGSSKDKDIDRAKYFLEVLDPLKPDVDKLEK